MFRLHPQLEKDCFFICDLPLSRALLLNNNNFPWIILVPRIPDLRELIDMPYSEQHTLLDEITHASRVIQTLFKPEKLNIAILGNQVPQLHVHVIARYIADIGWPKPPWGLASSSYPSVPTSMIERIRTAFSAQSA